MSPRRRMSAAAAKEAKMKKIAIVGGVLLLGLIGFQAPKVLKSLHSSSGTTETSAAPVEPATPPPSLTDEAPPVAGTGQLVSFSLFRAKDPFVQQIVADTNPNGGAGNPGYKSPGASGPAGTTPTATTPTATTEPLPPTTAPTTAPTTETAPVTPTTSPDTTATTTGTSTTSTSTSPASPQTGAAISTNGVCQAVAVGGTFPQSAPEPFFQLVSVAADGNSAQIGIAGAGRLDTGQPTVTLTKGKTLTLLNDTTRVRYVLALLDGCPVPTATDTTATTDTTDTTDTTATTTTTTVP
jgi:hypothetical protein